MLPRWASSADRCPSRISALQFLPLAAADAVDEVAEVESPEVGEAADRSALDRLALLLALGKELAFLDHALGRVELDGHLDRLLGDQAPLLAEQLDVAEVEDRQLGVGRLALVLVAEATAQADDALRRGAGGHGPARQVQLMRAQVPDLAVAEIPDPMPVVVHEIRAVRMHGRRADPEVVVQLRGRSLRIADADTLARPVDVDAGEHAVCRTYRCGRRRSA